MPMEWKDWTTLPDVDSTVVKALRTLVFDEVMKKKQIIRPIDAREYPRRVKDGLTLIGSRIIWFFVQNDNEWTPLGGVRHYLINKYGYAPTTVDGSGIMVMRVLCEEDEGLIRLKPDLYYRTMDIIDNENIANTLANRFPTLDLEFYERWLEAQGDYDDDGEDDEEEVSENEERSSLSLVLKDGSRFRVVLEVDVVIRSIRFEGE